MTTCLTTTLSESVSDTSLLKLGESRIHIEGASIGPIKITCNLVYTGDPLVTTGIDFTIVGNGYFTDSAGTSNLGKSSSITTWKDNVRFLPAGNYDLIVGKKYTIKGITLLATTNYRDLKAVEFGTDLFAGNASINYIGIPNTSFSGDIADFGANNPSLDTLDLSNTGAYGELKDVSNLTSLTTLKLESTYVAGNTSDLAGLTELTTFTYTNTAITGTWPLT